MNESDPIDHALAAIASIREQPEAQPDPAQPEPQEAKPQEAEPEQAAVDEQPTAPEVNAVEGYSKVGPGPMAAIRFKWTVRRDASGEYYVDETIGENSAPVISGPLAPDAAIRFVDDRASEAQERFEQLRSEMSGRAAAANLVRKDSGEM